MCTNREPSGNPGADTAAAAAWPSRQPVLAAFVLSALALAICARGAVRAYELRTED